MFHKKEFDKEYSKKYRKEHPEWKKISNKEYQEKHKYNWKEYVRRYQKKHPERVNHVSRLYQCRRRNADGRHTLEEWENLKTQYNWTCPCCETREPKIKLTEDHIIPITKGGSNNIENIQPLCVSCNSKKHTKIIRY